MQQVTGKLIYQLPINSVIVDFTGGHNGKSMIDQWNFV
nr:MAG TPA: hypothetical protein [Caudoviricetes sp.]